MEETYKVQLGDVFEGPMDLLVFLIRKNRVNIYDIPIAAIVDQYLEYIEWMKSMNIDLAGEFLVMAATLAHIKSRTLLPVVEGEEDAEDPRQEITRPLLEYLRMKDVAEQLETRNILGEDIFLRDVPKEERRSEEEFVQAGLFDLIEAFRNVLAGLPGRHQVDLNEEKISVKDRMRELADILKKQKSMTFSELVAPFPERGNLILTFLALLEMAKLSLIRIHQHPDTKVIRIIFS